MKKNEGAQVYDGECRRTIQCTLRQPYPCAVGAVNAVTLVNQQRAAHGSAPLKWDATIAASAQRWADNCVTAHSLSAYGENLSLLNSDNYYNALNAWYKVGTTSYAWYSVRMGQRAPVTTMQL